MIADKEPVVIGHRGYCSIAPENTLPSFKLALEAGVRFVELDYQQSHDGVPIVIHDDTLDRTTDARRRWRQRCIKVADRTSAEIEGLDGGGWYGPEFAATKVPLLTEALDFIQGSGGITVIEHKSGDVATCVELLRDRALIDRVVLMSFDWQWLRRFHELEPMQPLGALGVPIRLTNGRKPRRLFKTFHSRWLDELAKTGARLVVWNRQVPKAAIRAAHERGLKVWVYTVDEAAAARQLVARGVNGIITNRISAIRKALNA